MKIELKKISFSERMSEETNCFVADLYINGKNVGSCKNDGHGGCTDYYGSTLEDQKIIREAEAYCKTLPKVKFTDMEWEQSLEGVIDDLLTAHLKANAVKKFNKKMQKKYASAICYGKITNNGCEFTTTFMATKKFKVVYFLFGETVCRKLEREGLKEALAIAKDNGYSLYVWDENSTPFDLLNEFNGWNDFSVLTKRQYDAFAKF
jgi:hypothetical protein